MVRILSSIVVTLLLTASPSSPAASSNTLFEGLYRVTLNGQHVGYAIQRYEYDAKKKQFISTMFSKTSAAAGSTTESLKAYASQNLAPISYQYTAQTGDDKKSKITTIDATFKLRTVKITALKDGRRQVVEKSIPKNVFLSTFLYYRIMNEPKGLTLGTKYEFQALAEEDATIYSGDSWVQKLSRWNDFEATQVLNRFKDSKYLTWLNAKGEIYGTHSPLEGVRTELVTSLKEAAGDMPIKSKSLMILFGYLPSGLNDFTRHASAPPTAAKQGPPPSGQRIFIKGAKGAQAVTPPAQEPTDNNASILTPLPASTPEDQP